MNKLLFLTKIPGGIILLPMLASAIINTFIPEVLNVGEPVSSLLSGEGLMTLLAMNLFVAGTKLEFYELPSLFRKALFLGGGRVIIAMIASYVYFSLFGISGVYGVSIVAFVAAISSTNPAIFLSLTSKYGDKSDMSVFPILSFITQPLLPLFILSVGHGSSFDPLSVVALFLPFIIGMIMGNVSLKVRDMFAKATVILLPFWGLSVGSKINLIDAFSLFESGVFLALLFLVVCLIPMVALDKFINGKNGFTAAATCTVAAVCIIVPELAENMNTDFAEFTEAAQNQLATAVLITSLLVPFLAKQLLRIKKQ